MSHEIAHSSSLMKNLLRGETYFPIFSSTIISPILIWNTVRNIRNYFKPTNTTVPNSTFPPRSTKTQSDQIRFRGFVLRGQAETSLQLPRIETRARNWSALLFPSTNYRILVASFRAELHPSWSLPRNNGVGSTD